VISDEKFANYAAFTLMPRLYARLPKDLQSWRTFHGGENRPFSPDRVLAVPADDNLQVRCDHAASGNRRMCVTYGPVGRYPLRIVNNFRGHVIDPGTLDETPVELTKDHVFTAGFARGVILLGEIF
jgi:hypothetical protein